MKIIKNINIKLKTLKIRFLSLALVYFTLLSALIISTLQFI